MKKVIVITVSIILIGILVVTIYPKDNSEIKRTSLIEQVPNKDISQLLILKDAPTEPYKNDYYIQYISDGIYYFKDQYRFNDSSMIGIGITAYILEGENEEQVNQEDNVKEIGEKITFKNVEAYYNISKMPTVQTGIYQVIEQLFFSKDNINYLISTGYYHNEKNKKPIDFLIFLEKNLILVGKNEWHSNLTFFLIIKTTIKFNRTLQQRRVWRKWKKHLLV